MTYPAGAPVAAAPRVVPTGGPTPAPAGRTGAGAGVGMAPGRGRLSAFLATRNGKLAAAGGAVAAFALYKRIRSSKDPGSSTAGDAAAGTAGAGIQGGVDTSATDVYNALEPLIEHMSGYTDATNINKQLADLNTQLAALKNQKTTEPAPGGGTTLPGTTPTPTSKAFTDQLHYVGKPGETVSLDAAVKKYFPGATPTQVKNIEYWSAKKDTPSNLWLWISGKVPGGFHATFLGSQANNNKR